MFVVHVPYRGTGRISTDLLAPSKWPKAARWSPVIARAQIKPEGA